MKFSFLQTRVSIVIIFLILGLIFGFKIANSQYRREHGPDAMAAAGAAQGGSHADAGSQGLSPQQREQVMNEMRQIIDKAKNNPNDAEAQLEAADQFIQFGRPEEAIPFLEKADKAKPNDARTMAGLSMASFMLEKYDDSVKWSKKSIDINQENPGASFLLVASYIRLRKNLDEAESILKRLEVQKVDPTILANARKELESARTGKSPDSQPGSDSKTVLGHGPEDPNTGKSAAKPGGRQ